MTTTLEDFINDYGLLSDRINKRGYQGEGQHVRDITELKSMVRTKYPHIENECLMWLLAQTREAEIMRALKKVLGIDKCSDPKCNACRHEEDFPVKDNLDLKTKFEVQSVEGNVLQEFVNSMGGDASKMTGMPVEVKLNEAGEIIAIRQASPDIAEKLERLIDGHDPVIHVNENGVVKQGKILKKEDKVTMPTHCADRNLH